MAGYRKIERVETPLVGEKHWNEIAFSELRRGDVFKITDLDDNGKMSIMGEDGKTIRIATSDPYTGENGVYTIEAEEYEGEENEIFADSLSV